MRQYFLSKLVHACVHGDQVILLDLRSGRYQGLRSSDAQSIAGCVQGWPFAGGASDEGLAKRLVERGLLTADPAQGKDTKPPCVAPPTSTIYDMFPDTPPQIRVHHVWNFVISFLTAWFALRLLPMRRIAARASALKKKGTRRVRVAEIDTLVRLVGEFDQLRPFAFCAHDACMLHSLALARFMARYGAQTDWVFGVRTDPFEAHCWLQHGQTILNDRHPRVDGMTPIMVI